MALSREVERRIATFVPPVVVALVALPFVLRQNSWWEWTTAYWLLERQAEHVSAHGVPTLFLHSSFGGFYPIYLFYAGFTLSLLAYPAALIGAWPVFAATCVAAPVVGYLGIWWTARNLGLSHRLAVLPGLAFAATPYLVADLYGRASWAELLAVNAVPAMLGGLTALLWHPERGRAGALAALVASAAIIAGTHNITLLLTAITMPLLVAALLPLVPRATGAAGGAAAIARQIGLGALAIALGAGLTAAWLLPNLWFGSETWAADPSTNHVFLDRSTALNHAGSVLSATPTAPEGTWFYAQPPVLPLAWAVIALVIVAVMRRRHGAQAATSTALIALGTGLVLLVLHPAWWSHFPHALQTLQNPVRLLPYVAVVGTVAIIVALAAMPAGRVRVALTTVLVLAVGVQVYLGARITTDTTAGSGVPTPALGHGDVTASDEPPAYAAEGSFAPYQFMVAKPTTNAPPQTKLPVAIADPLTSDTGQLRGSGNVGERFSTSVIWSRFVRVDGDARITDHATQGMAIITVTRTGPGGRWAATARSLCSGLCLSQLEPGATWQLPVGRLLTLLSALLLLAAAVTGRRRRRSARVVVEPATAPAVTVDDVPAPLPTAQ